MSYSPPHLPLRFFRWFCHPKVRDFIEGDLMELHEERKVKSGKSKADVLLVKDILLLFRPGIIKPIEGYKNLNTYAMLKSYFKIGWRNLLRNKGLFAINISGLAIGIATCLMIIMFIIDELSYDRYNKKADQIVRVLLKGKVNGEIIKEAVTAAPVGSTLKNEFPEVIDATRLRKVGTPKIAYKGNILKNPVAFVDPNFFTVFTLPFIQGNPQTALLFPNSIVITKEQAEKYFGSEDPINKLLEFKDTKVNYKVTGIIEKVPTNSHFHFDFFASMEGLAHSKEDKWLESNYFTYVVLEKGTDLNQFEAKMPGIIKKYMGPQVAQLGMTLEKFQESGNEIGLFIQPLTDIHLFSDFAGTSELEAGGNINSLYIFGAVALFMLFIACINFMNLSTAGATKRSKEVGVKKVLGSQKSQLVYQFLVESFIATAGAMILGLLIVTVCLPVFNQLSGKELDVTFLLKPKVLITLLGGGLIIGLLSGSYPAFFLSSIKPITALKNKFSNGGKGKGIRSVLVVFQFVISVTLILAIIVVSQQMSYIQDKNIGYNRDQRIVLRESYLLGANENVFKNQLLTDPRIESVTRSAFIPAGPTDNNMTSVWVGDNKENFRRTVIYGIDSSYISTMGMQLTTGRNFLEGLASENDKVIVNEAFIRAFSLQGNPLGQAINQRTDNDGGFNSLTIVGVIKDFHFRSLHEPIAPLMMLNNPYGGLIIKTQTPEMSDLISSINEKWLAFHVEEPFTYALLDE
jgi:putative ABC transport system permease protein